MEECVHRTGIPPLPVKINREITPEQKKWSSPNLNFELGLPFMAPVFCV